ncbi:ParB N-terminal domain-containing protein [Bradyrhizobium barranii subsp. apii]|uniref:ParB N-terminal domain-containing protein n=1 Tax=Bradyrhizobium barranii TaxID=2992140 RepID=UPI0020661203|nr:ParB N-terminal domain-containing protein [Bradyrhizobium barranii]UPT99243.1 ParB N-terminal domain-containing protein [Bradyrhizobium barranii subsp. apii]
MMTDEELGSLAASIADNGLRDPIILGKVKGSTEQPAIVDGRNRDKACGMTGVQPRFEVIEFEDEDAIRAFVKDRSERRDISKGQRAMGHALLFPDAEKGGRGKKKVPETGGFSRQRLGEARTVLAFSRELALKVRDGSVKLDQALATVAEARKAVETDEGKFARLDKEAPDLAELVTEDRMKLDEAIAALDARQRQAEAEEKNKREVEMRLSEALYRGALAWAVPAFVNEVAERLADNPDYRRDFLERLRLDPSTLADIRKGADHFFDVLTNQKD